MSSTAHTPHIKHDFQQRSPYTQRSSVSDVKYSRPKAPEEQTPQDSNEIYQNLFKRDKEIISPGSLAYILDDPSFLISRCDRKSVPETSTSTLSVKESIPSSLYDNHSMSAPRKIQDDWTSTYNSGDNFETSDSKETPMVQHLNGDGLILNWSMVPNRRIDYSRQKSSPYKYLSDNQREILLEYFNSQTRHPSNGEMEVLATSLELPYKKVRVWFQNRRARHPL